MLRILSMLLMVTAPTSEAGTCLQVKSGQVEFTIVQMGAPFSGRFTRFGGAVCMSGPAVEKLSVWLEPGSVETGLPDLDAALQELELFQTDAFDRVLYQSTDIRLEQGRYVADGTLTMKGIEKPLTVTFTATPTGSTTEISGKTGIQRLNFAVGTGEWSDTDLLSDNVSVRFHAVLGTPATD